ncbi:MAG: 16S rRNA (guanine(966)-N(2))-methyltransferase RsmD [Pseudomonadota bacterium]
MRIIAGKHKGRNLLSPKDKSIRPTASKMREAIFNILASRNVINEETIVTDLCCGTGALGLESLSRGARQVIFIDESQQNLTLAWMNIKSCKEEENAIILRANAENLPIAKVQSNLVFLDPPYFKGISEKALVSLMKQNWLTNEALIIIELDKKEDLNYPTSHYNEVSIRFYGNSKIILLEKI